MKKILLVLTMLLSMSLLAACSDANVEKKSAEAAEKGSGIEKKADENTQEPKADMKKEVQKNEEAASSDKVVENQQEEHKDAETGEQKTVKEGFRPGNLAKDVEFELWEDGSVANLSDYKGQPIVLNFWASWCPHCVHELPALNEAYKEYAEKGVKVIGINLSFQDDANAARKAMEKVGAEFINASDHTGVATSAFGVRGIPASIFIDKDGIIYENKAGAMTKEEFSEHIKAIVE